MDQKEFNEKVATNLKSDNMEEFYKSGLHTNWYITDEDYNVSKDIEFYSKLFTKFNGPVLDVGAGFGTYLSKLNKFIEAPRWVAADISQTALAQVPEGIDKYVWDIRDKAPTEIQALNPFLTIVRETLYYLPNPWLPAAQNVADIVPKGSYLLSCDALIRIARRTCWRRLGFELVDHTRYHMKLISTGQLMGGRLLKLDLYIKV